MSEISILVRPHVGIKMYLPECIILLAFAVVPPLLAWGGYLALDRTGGLMVLVRFSLSSSGSTGRT